MSSHELRWTKRRWPSDLADALDRQRIQRGLSQKNTALAMGVTRHDLMKWLTGRRYPRDPQSIEAVALFLGVGAAEVTALYESSRKRREAAQAEEARLRAEERARLLEARSRRSKPADHAREAREGGFGARSSQPTPSQRGRHSATQPSQTSSKYVPRERERALWPALEAADFLVLVAGPEGLNSFTLQTLLFVADGLWAALEVSHSMPPLLSEQPLAGEYGAYFPGVA